MTDTAMPLALPAVLQGRYRLGPLIGRGGASVVIRAHDTLLDRDVAVKAFTARATDPHDLRTQESEARMLAAMSHHGLVTLLDAGIDVTDPERPQVYLILELVEGRDLRLRLADGPLAPVDVAYLGFDLAGAIDYVHRHGVIHRDIKPANVLVVDAGTDRPRGKLADFGIALLRGDARPEEQTTGTAAYLSPEQVEGHALTPATDVYSLGLVLLEALTAELAFPGAIVEAALARLERPPVVPSSVPPEIAALLRAMTARSPEDRPTPAEVELGFRRIVVGSLAAPPPAAEEARVAAVRRYDLLDTPPDGAFDRITALAARLTGAPIAVVGLTDVDRVWLKSRVGLDLEELPMPTSGPLLERTTVVADAAAESQGRFSGIVRALGVRSVAGVPLVAADGYHLGVLAVGDRVPRTLSADQVAALEDLAALVVHEMELRRAVRRAMTSREDGVLRRVRMGGASG